MIFAQSFTVLNFSDDIPSICIAVSTFHIMLMTSDQNKIWGCDASTIFHAILHC